MLPRFLIVSILILSALSCQPEKKKDLEVETTIPSQESDNPQPNDSVPLDKQESYVPQSTDPQTAANLKNFLKNYAGDDYEILTDNDKRFQFYKVDLDDDGNEEIFVRFMGPFYCGSGGCTFLLLDKFGEIITRFTVTRAPFFIEPTKVNGWSLLLVKDSGVFKELIFENGSYPGNPSVLPKAPYDAPSGHAAVVFDETFARSKTYTF